MKKKTFVVLLALVLALGMFLTACGPKEEPKKTDPPAADNTDDSKPEVSKDSEPSEEPAPSEDSEPSEEPEPSDEPETPARAETDTLVIAQAEFNEIFSPFFAQTQYDRDVSDMTQINIIGFDAYAQPDDSGACVYQEPEKVGDDYVYTFKLKEGLTFSDGEPVTADDIIFNFKVFLDPKYNGNTTLYTLPIKGALDYKYDTADYEGKLEEIAQAVEAYAPTAEEVEAKAKELYDMYSGQGYEVELPMFQEGGDYYEDETIASLKEDFETKQRVEWIEGNLADGIDYPEIEGVKKISDTEVEVHMTRLDPTAVYKLGLNIAPMHYYGEGFEKGKLDGVKAKDKEPMGAGSYIFKGFKDNVVSFEANPTYYKGEPKIKKLKFQVVPQTSKLEATARGDVDISDPAANPEMKKEAEKFDNIHVELVDNNGYGYIGINAKLITDKLVRQGIMHLLDRQPAVDAAYGELASVIERPISRTNWAYPQSATEYYGFNKEKALAKFKEAGYEVDAEGKLVKDGKQLHITANYPGGEDDDHPVKPVFTRLKEVGEEIGLKVDVQNHMVNPFFAALDAGQLEIWAAAWAAAADPDMTQIYKSDSPGNKYGIDNADLDKLIEDGLKTTNVDERKKIYSDALDIIMEEAVEMPFYQRKNMFVYNTDIVDVDTLPDVMTPFWSHMAEIEKLELVAE